ncbi:MAG: tyrosine-protein phosphatase [Treponema sp.]|jgi:protein-tyrosine phosphatase|nr:tyrosine-protein phosphatase [Treponema sp.]
MKNDETKPEKERFLPLQTLFNVRDLGGYAAAGKRRVKWGLLYRAGDLHNPGPEDKTLLEKRGIKTIVDFRDSTERDRAPDYNPDTALQNRWLPISAGSVADLAGAKTGAATETFMRELYAALVDTAREQYQEFFALLGDSRNLPLLFHCSAGKDRTGIGAALVLAALGVDRDCIYDDYLLSVRGLGDKYANLIEKSPYLEPLFSVRRPYLAEAFQRIDAAYGGMDRYLREELGAEPNRLRELYTE